MDGNSFIYSKGLRHFWEAHYGTHVCSLCALWTFHLKVATVCMASLSNNDNTLNTEHKTRVRGQQQGQVSFTLASPVNETAWVTHESGICRQVKDSLSSLKTVTVPRLTNGQAANLCGLSRREHLPWRVSAERPLPKWQIPSQSINHTGRPLPWTRAEIKERRSTPTDTSQTWTHIV